jgi:hypothetical protein
VAGQVKHKSPHEIRTDNELSYQEEQQAPYNCPVRQHYHALHGMQDSFPIESSVSLWLIIFDSRAEPQIPPLFSSIPAIDAKSCEITK